MSEIIERLTPLLAASASSEKPRVARNSRTRPAMRWLRSEANSSILDALSNIVDRTVKHPLKALALSAAPLLPTKPGMTPSLTLKIAPQIGPVEFGLCWQSQVGPQLMPPRPET